MELKPNTSHRNLLPTIRFANEFASLQINRLRLFIVVLNLSKIIFIVACAVAILPRPASATDVKPNYSSFYPANNRAPDQQQNNSKRSTHGNLDAAQASRFDENDFPNPSAYDVTGNHNDHEDADQHHQFATSSHDHLESSYDPFGSQQESGPASSSLSENSFPLASNNDQQHHLPAASIGQPPESPVIPVQPEPEPEQNKAFISIHFIREVCRLNRGSQRSESLNDTYMNYCNRYKLENLLSNEILMSIMHRDSQECEQILGEFIKLDELINQFDGMFKNLLTRYNCHNGYSVKWNCEDCKKAYKDWLCATHLPFYMNGERIKPCISFCERVEQRCPYLHPITKEQYGGQPVFICRDPNIPFIPEITPDIPFSEPRFCYDLCHLTQNTTELSNDTLSKYDHRVCPAISSIAEEVRKDPYYCGPYGHCKHPTNLERGQQPDRPSNVDRMPTSTAQPPIDGDYEDFKPLGEDGDASDVLANKSSPQPHGHQTSQKKFHAHLKRLDELREVLAVYKNQPKSHKFGHHVDHASLSPPPSMDHHHSLVSESIEY